MKYQVGIIGNGWLGKELKKKFDNENINCGVFSRNTTDNNLITRYLIGKTVPKSLLEPNTLIVAVPPALRKSNPEEVLASFARFIEQLKVDTFFIYTSSSSVYLGTGLQTESSACAGTIFEMENLIRTKFKKHLILRLAGLAGPGRTIVNILQKKGCIDNYDAPCNLAHLDDVAEAITMGVRHQIMGTYNICSMLHPTKSDVYTQWNTILNLPRLANGSKSIGHKIIDSKKWRLVSNQKFKFDSPLDFSF